MSKKNRLVLLFIGYTFLAFSSLTESITTKIKYPFSILYHYINRDKIIANNRIQLLTEKMKHREKLLKELQESDIANDEKITLQEKYRKEIEHLSYEIAQEKNKIQLEEYNNKKWLIKAVSFGAIIGLASIVAYKLLTMPTLPMQINKDINQAISTPPISTHNEIHQEESLADSSWVINSTPPSNHPVITIPPQKTELSKKQLKEKKLYESRSKNYTNTATLAFLNVIFGWAIWGPMHLPIDAVLLALSLASGAEAWHYKQKAEQLSVN